MRGLGIQKPEFGTQQSEARSGEAVIQESLEAP
jgi:hypothetical protein